MLLQCTGPEYPRLTPFFDLSATSSSMTNKVTGLKRVSGLMSFFRVPAFNKLEQHWGTTTAGELLSVRADTLGSAAFLSYRPWAWSFCGFIRDPESGCCSFTVRSAARRLVAAVLLCPMSALSLPSRLSSKVKQQLIHHSWGEGGGEERWTINNNCSQCHEERV